MDLPTLTEEQLTKFRWILNRFDEHVRLPSPDYWKTVTSTDVWIRIVSQVVVVGKAEPAKRLKDPDIRAKLDYERLRGMSAIKAAKEIGEALLAIKTRYVSDLHPESSPKVVSLIKNLAFLKTYDDGPRGFIRDVAALKTSEQRWKYVAKHLSYIKNKGARDFLTTGFGLATDHIALDSRVMGIVNRIVPDLPAKVQPTEYAAIEKFLVDSVCRPLKITAAHLDQLLFLYQRRIVAGLGSIEQAENLTSVTSEALLRQHCQILSELKRRQILRTGNNPTGDYAEWLAAQKLGLKLQGNSAKGFDAVDASGRRYQIKARRIEADTPSIQLSPMRNLTQMEFDDLLVIIFNADFEVKEALIVPHAVALAASKHRDHVKGHVLLVRDSLRQREGVKDVTEQLA